LLSLAVPCFAAHAAPVPASTPDASAPLRFVLATLEHDHAWWTMDHIRETPGVELVGVFDRQEHLREKARKRLTNSVSVFDDPEKMLKACQPDALIVTAPNNEHRALVELAARHRIHCLVQKPMATTAADARAMLKPARAAGITLMVNYYPLWQPVRHELLTRAKAGEIGEVQQMTVVNGMQGPRDMNVLTPDYRKWMYDPERNGGGVMGDQVTYGLDYVLWVMGRPESVVATITPLKQHEEGVDDLATLTLGYPRGQAVVIASWAWPHPRGELFCAGSRGSLTLRDKDIVRRNAPERFNVPVEETVIQPSATIPPERKHGIAYFAHVLRHKLPVEEPHSAELNVVVCEVVDAARESARTGRRIKLKPHSPLQP
jgi:predicted dehydrogenase